MKFIKKHKVLTVFLLVMAIMISFYITHPTYYRYNDCWIIGNTIENVKERYGEFDITTGGWVGYYIYTDNKGFLPDHLKHYYHMFYDENGVIYKVIDSSRACD